MKPKFEASEIVEKNEPAFQTGCWNSASRRKNTDFGSFRHEVPILAGCRAVGPLCIPGFRGEIPLELPSPKARLEAKSYRGTSKRTLMPGISPSTGRVGTARTS